MAIGRKSLHVAKFVIEKDKIYIENANLTHGHGALDPVSFQPFPKNPPISKVFREIGLADELGSGMRNTYKYTKMYSGCEPSFLEDSVFRITVPLSDVATKKVGPEAAVTNSDNVITKSETQISASTDTSIPINTDKIPINTDKREEIILEYIRTNGEITNKEACEILGLSSSTIKKIFERMVSAGKITTVGEKKSRRYIK